MNLFQADDGATKSISVSSSSQAVQLESVSEAIQVRVYNAGTATVWIRFGGSAVTAASATDIPIAAGYTGGFSVGAAGSTIYVAAIAAGSTGSIYFTPGEGI